MHFILRLQSASVVGDLIGIVHRPVRGTYSTRIYAAIWKHLIMLLFVDLTKKSPQENLWA